MVTPLHMYTRTEQFFPEDIQLVGAKFSIVPVKIYKKHKVEARIIHVFMDSNLIHSRYSSLV